MENFYTKNIAELSVLEILKFAYLVSIHSNITMDMNAFCNTIGKEKRKVYQLLRKKAFPEKIIYGGYDSMKQRKSPLFITKEVLKYIENGEITN